MILKQYAAALITFPNVTYIYSRILNYLLNYLLNYTVIDE